MCTILAKLCNPNTRLVFFQIVQPYNFFQLYTAIIIHSALLKSNMYDYMVLSLIIIELFQ